VEVRASKAGQDLLIKTGAKVDQASVLIDNN